MIKLLVAIAFIGLNAYIYNWMARDAVVPPRENFASFPMEFSEWRCSMKGKITDEIRQNLGATDYLICNYEHPEQVGVNVYVGYHESQVREEGGGSGENSIHPPAHCLPGSGWDIIANETVLLDVPGLPQSDARGKRLIIAKGEARQLVYYWYQSRGRVIAEDWKKIVYVGWDRARLGRTDGSLVRFTTQIIRNDVEAAEQAVRELATELLPRLPDYVPS